MSRLRQRISVPLRRSAIAVATVLVLSASGYLLWEATPGARFQREYAAAERALAEYDFAAARRHLAECRALRPEDPGTHLLSARTARRDGDLDAAADYLIRYHELTGETTEDEKIEWALLQAQRGEVHRVVNDLIELLDIRHPASELILEALAMGCVQAYRFDQAGFWINELLEKNPKSAIARLLRAQAGEALGVHAKAQQSLRELLADYPKFRKARLHLADSLVRSRGYDEAATHFEKLHRESSDDLAPLLGLARCRELQGRDDEARPLIRRLEQEFRDNSEAMLECGRFALKEGRFADAEPLLRRAVELAPHDHEAHLNLGTCLQQLGYDEEAAAHTQRAKQIEADLSRLEKDLEASVKDPADPAPRLEAGEICLRNGQDAEGLRWLSGILERNPDHKPTHKVLADYFAARGDARQAEEHRRRSR
jgi:tetratricopeptide (TPR) repeat protein